LRKAIGQHGQPDKVTIDQSGANTAAIEDYNSANAQRLSSDKTSASTTSFEQDHRAVKRQVRPMMGFKSFWSAAITIAGIELMHMIAKVSCKAGTPVPGAAVLCAG